MRCALLRALGVASQSCERAEFSSGREVAAGRSAPQPLTLTQAFDSSLPRREWDPLFRLHLAGTILATLRPQCGMCSRNALWQVSLMAHHADFSASPSLSVPTQQTNLRDGSTARSMSARPKMTVLPGELPDRYEIRDVSGLLTGSGGYMCDPVNALRFRSASRRCTQASRPRTAVCCMLKLTTGLVLAVSASLLRASTWVH